MDLLTISSMERITSKKEEVIPGLIEDKESRPFVFDKKTIFLTARVHPGEVAA